MAKPLRRRPRSPIFSAGGEKANIVLARKFLGVISHILKNNCVVEDLPNFVLAS
jgi:hypothetical protein